jgi:hypothetical protein
MKRISIQESYPMMYLLRIASPEVLKRAPQVLKGE